MDDLKLESSSKLGHTVVVVTLLLSLSGVSCQDEIECKASDWWNSAITNKYLRRRTESPLSYIRSKNDCLLQGARLLSVHTAAEQHEIRDWLKSDCGWSTRIGLTSDSSGVHTWEDGSVLKAGDFKNWTTGHPVLEKHCVAVKFCPGQWVSEPCSYGRQYFCEAIKGLCSPVPALNFNDTMFIKNHELTLTNEENVVVRCYLQGDSSSVTKVTLMCGENSDITATGEKSAEQNVKVVDLHKKNCTCKSMLSDGTSEMTRVGVTYHFSPRFVHKDMNRNYSVTEKKGFITILEIKSSPDLTDCMVTRQDGNKTDMDCTIDVKNSSQIMPFHTNVSIAVDHVRMSYSGNYSVVVKNGIPQDMIYVFNLHVKAIKKEKDEPIIGAYVWGILAGLIILAIVVVVIFAIRRQLENFMSRESGETGYYQSSISNIDTNTETEDAGHFQSIHSNEEVVNENKDPDVAEVDGLLSDAV